MQPQPDTRPKRHFRIGGLITLLLILVVPLWMSQRLGEWSGGGPIEHGDQPGGPVRGLITDTDGHPLEGLSVELYLGRGESPPQLGVATRTAADGTFELKAPPHEGHYLLQAGGGDWQTIVRHVSLLGLGAIEDRPPIEIELRPGASMRIGLARLDGKSVGKGTLVMEGQLGSASRWNFFAPGIRLTQSFEGGEWLIDGLPPVSGKVALVLDSGERIEFDVELDEGERFERHFDF